jgi:hypothetical protein
MAALWTEAEVAELKRLRSLHTTIKRMARAVNKTPGQTYYKILSTEKRFIKNLVRPVAAPKGFPYLHKTCAEVFAEEDSHASLNDGDTWVRPDWRDGLGAYAHKPAILRDVQSDRS